MGKLICSNCGAEVIIPEHSSRIEGITFSEDSIGTHYLRTKENTNMGKAQERLDAMKAAGMDTSKYFVAPSPVSGQEMLMKWGDNNSLELVPEDATEKSILDYGYTDNKNLFKRWVAAQYFRMDNDRAYYESLKNRGYSYQWKVLKQMMHRLAKLETSDLKAFNEEVRYYNKNLVLDCIRDYEFKLIRYFKSLPKLKCKGADYVRAGWKYGTHKNDLFVDDIEKVVRKKIDYYYHQILKCDNYKAIESRLSGFINNCLINFPYYSAPKMSNTFINAYTGYGAYFTLQNLVRFHGINLTNYKTKEKYLDEKLSEKYLVDVAEEYARICENWRLLALLRQTVDRENFVVNW